MRHRSLSSSRGRTRLHTESHINGQRWTEKWDVRQSVGFKGFSQYRIKAGFNFCSNLNFHCPRGILGAQTLRGSFRTSRLVPTLPYKLSLINMYASNSFDAGKNTLLHYNILSAIGGD